MAKSKNVPVFVYFSKKDKGDKGSEYKKYNFNKLMSNIGGEVYSYESFKELYDSSEVLQNIIDDLDETGIVFNSSDEEFDNDDNDKEEDNSVGDNNRKSVTNAAKRATKKRI